MSVTQRIWLWTAFSVVVTIVPLSVMTHLPGLAIPLPYWIFAIACPGITSYFVAYKLIHQGERLRVLHLDLLDAHALLEQVAVSDPLTQVLNRGGFLDRLQRRQSGRAGWLLLVDADHFKSINDRFGHEVGDRALQAMVDVMRSTVRDGDLIGRLGGEEFGIFLHGVAEDVAMGIAERIRQRVQHAAVFDLAGNRVSMTVSIGVTRLGSSELLRDSLRQADGAMYRAKHNGRNQIILNS